MEDVSETAINATFKGQKPTGSKAKPAAASIYDDPYSGNFCQRPFIALIAKTSIRVATSEAHDLINKWVVDKIRLDLDDDIGDYVKPSEMHRITEEERDLREFKKKLLSDEDDFDSKLDHYLHDLRHEEPDKGQGRAKQHSSVLDISGFDYDKYSEAYIAKDIVSQMLKKDLVSRADLMTENDDGEHKSKGRGPRVIDYKAKMDMRQHMVKENREKRQREVEEKRKERLLKKEIEFKAKQMVQREQIEKQMKQNLEEELLEKEVQRLRAVMNEQRKQEAEIRKK